MMTETKKAAEAKKPEKKPEVKKVEDKKVETKAEDKKTEVKADTNVKFVEPKTSSASEKKAPVVKPVIENPKFQAPDFSIHLANTTEL